MKKYKIGFICGFFDILHDGHIEILQKAKEYCDYLIVAVGTDELMLSRKNRKSIFSYDQRVKILSAIKYVDLIVPEINLDKVGDYHKYHFNVMFAGDDHLNEPLYIESTKKLKTLNVDTIYIPRYNNMSSTCIRKKVIEQNI